ncbi:hypothetical protein D3C76_1639640 [compost metagenome]
MRHAVYRFAFLRVRQREHALHQLAVFRRACHLLHAAKAQAGRFHRFVALALFQLNQQLFALQFRFLFGFVALDQFRHAIFYLVERLNAFWLVA